MDTLGAGDTFIASSIYGLTKSLDLPSALTFGCRIAGEKCGMLGYTGLKDIVLNLKDYFMLNDV